MNMYACVCVCIYIYMYIYTYRVKGAEARVRAREARTNVELQEKAQLLASALSNSDMVRKNKKKGEN